jgi:iron complex outermembrane receptor protein
LAVGPCSPWVCTELNPLTPGGNALVNGNPLPQSAKYIGDLALRYSIPVSESSELYLFTDWSYRSTMNAFIDRETEYALPSLYQAGFRVGYSWANGKYEVAAFCRNCTNIVRNISGINFDNLTGIVNDPRIIGGQVKVAF